MRVGRILSRGSDRGRAKAASPAGDLPPISSTPTPSTRPPQDYLFFDLLWSDPQPDQVDGIEEVRGDVAWVSPLRLAIFSVLRLHPTRAVVSGRGLHPLWTRRDDRFSVTQLAAIAYPLPPGQHHTSSRHSQSSLQTIAAPPQVPSDGHGYELLHDGKCITVFSASNYGGTQYNTGAVVVWTGGQARLECVHRLAHIRITCGRRCCPDRRTRVLGATGRRPQGAFAAS